MSTEVIGKTFDCLRPALIEHINDYPFDMLDEFTDEQIAEETISIAERLLVRDFCNGHIIRKGRPHLDYLYSVNNKEGNAFVSFSNPASGTGVSKSLYKCFWFGDDVFGALCNLAEMINEAWYHCNN